MQRITWLVYIGIHLFAAAFVVGVRCANPTQDNFGNLCTSGFGVESLYF